MGHPRIVKHTSIQSIFGIAVILSHVLLRNVQKIKAITNYNERH